MVAILEAIHARKVFGGGLPGHRATTAVEDFSLVFDDEKPSITAVVGESGSGKTMTARLLLGFETPTAGEIQYRGKQLNSLDGGGVHSGVMFRFIILSTASIMCSKSLSSSLALQDPARNEQASSIES